jgi:hypothetical protein
MTDRETINIEIWNYEAEANYAVKYGGCIWEI